MKYLNQKILLEYYQFLIPTKIQANGHSLVDFMVKKLVKIDSIKGTRSFALKSMKQTTNVLNLPNNYSDEQIEVINKRWKVIEKSYRDTDKENS